MGAVLLNKLLMSEVLSRRTQPGGGCIGDEPACLRGGQSIKTARQVLLLHYSPFAAFIRSKNIEISQAFWARVLTKVFVRHFSHHSGIRIMFMMSGQSSTRRIFVHQGNSLEGKQVTDEGERGGQRRRRRRSAKACAALRLCLPHVWLQQPCLHNNTTSLTWGTPKCRNRAFR